MMYPFQYCLVYYENHVIFWEHQGVSKIEMGNVNVLVGVSFWLHETRQRLVIMEIEIVISRSFILSIPRVQYYTWDSRDII